MDNSNGKLITVSFVAFAAICALSLSMLLQTFSGAFGFIARMMDQEVIRHGLPVAFGLAIFIYLQFNKKILVWADEVLVELKKVVWPSRKDTVGMTIVVCIMVLISSLIISTFDFTSGYLVNVLIK